jgi:Ser/Thr protein kinase RdoA (MazF antagonist)
VRKPDVDASALAAVVARAFGPAHVDWQRAAEGVSAQVYRLARGDEVFYLRVAESAEANLGVEAALLHELRRLGVSVPEVVFLERNDAALERSVLITTAVPGAPLERASMPDVLRAAGRDLAVLNRLPVDGFGWIRRDADWPLAGELAAYDELVVSELPSPWPGPLAALLSNAELDALQALFEAERRRPVASLLAHGDFDTTQIFHQDGRYTGLIDFGDIRGADPYFDLGTFHLVHGKRDPDFLPHLLEGYRAASALQLDGEAILRSAILLGLRQLSRWVERPTMGVAHPWVVGRARRIGALLEEPPPA